MLQRRASGFVSFLTRALVAIFIARNIVRTFGRIFEMSILLVILVLDLGKRLLMLSIRVVAFGFGSSRFMVLRRRRGSAGP